MVKMCENAVDLGNHYHFKLPRHSGIRLSFFQRSAPPNASMAISLPAGLQSSNMLTPTAVKPTEYGLGWSWAELGVSSMKADAS